MIAHAILLTFCLAAVWWFVRNDAAEYASFKLLTDTADRQKRFRAWILKCFLLFSGATLAGLAILGRLRALILLPAEFASLAGRVQSVMPAPQTLHPEFLVGFGFALAVGIIAGALAMKASSRKTGPIVLGDIQPLMPRNWAETAWAAGLSLNAGLSEELFFRLLLPLLVTGLFRNALLGVGFAVIVFGLVHFYQGPVGIVATTILGLALSGVYLWTGSLWIAVVVHACLDLIGLVVRPTIARLVKRA